MTIFESIKDFLTKKENIQRASAPKGYCPNCWGRQEYGGEFFEAMKTNSITTENIDKKKGWIQAYAEKNLIGIQLTTNDAQLICNNCKVNYSKTDHIQLAK